jgi:hypothetical protein
MSQDQHARKNYNIKTRKKPSARVEWLKYLGTTLTNRNSILEELKSRMNLGSVCYNSVQNLFAFQFAIQKYKDKTQKTKLYQLFCMGVVLGLSHSGRNNGRGCMRLSAQEDIWA